MRNSEQFGSTITIRVPSPASFSHEDVVSRDTQSASGREPIRAESSPLKADVTLSCKRMPPSYSQLRIIHEGDRTTSRVMLGQSSLFVGESPEQAAVFANRCRMASCGPTTSATASSTSPKSLDSGSNSSVDSGQGSGGLSLRSHSSKDFSESGTSYTQYARSNLPSYVRVASIMDHVLRTSSAMNSLLGSTSNVNTSKELITKANMFIQDITVIKELLSDLQSQPNCSNRPIVTSSYFAFVLRKLMDEVLMIFARSGGLNAISSFIRMPTTPNDTLRLLLRTLAILCRLPKGALKLLSVSCMLLFVHCPMEMVNLIRFRGLKFVRVRTAFPRIVVVRYVCPEDGRASSDAEAPWRKFPSGQWHTLVQLHNLFQLGRLDIIIQILCTRSVGCAVEAAGVLAQLTNPTHALIKLNDSSTYIIARLLDVVDECSTAESLLLCAAAIANISAQHRALVDNLYQHNATARLIAALKRPACGTVFVHEQLAVVFSRLANEGYEEALIAQGALPILLSMLTLSDLTHVEYCYRIRYKAAVCLATIASKGFGLKAIFQNNGYTMISKAIKKEQVSTTPTAMICNGIKEKLERKYQLESAV
uniref:Protein inscuteable homologue C-terminal domain-containing protein n=1 Tax=Parascaris univalens TaxID=6257 RepID=A0A915AIV5_PARUN